MIIPTIISIICMIILVIIILIHKVRSESCVTPNPKNQSEQECYELTKRALEPYKNSKYASWVSQNTFRMAGLWANKYECGFPEVSIYYGLLCSYRGIRYDTVEIETTFSDEEPRKFHRIGDDYRPDIIEVNYIIKFYTKDCEGTRYCFHDRSLILSNDQQK